MSNIAGRLPERSVSAHAASQRGSHACVLFLLTGLSACTSVTQQPDARQGESRAPMAAASGVTRADAGKTPREYRIIPLRPMAGDVEILYGNPEASGEPFVMRIRELAGTVIPPHEHPVDEHITVVQGAWYFGFGEEFDAGALEELKPGDAKSTFHFSRGDRVIAARGSGCIVEGYASGAIIQYEIEGSQGDRFMAHQHELRAQ